MASTSAIASPSTTATSPPPRMVSLPDMSVLSVGGGAEAAASASAVEDKRLLAAATAGQTDLVLQLLEEEGGQGLHRFKDEVRYTVFICLFQITCKAILLIGSVQSA